MKCVDLDLSFKGDRDYLHGTSLYDGVMAWIVNAYGERPITELDVSYHRLARTQVAIYSALRGNQEEPLGVLSFSSEGRRRKLFLYETGQPVTVRSDCGEDQICSQVVVDNDQQKATMSPLPGFTDIELWVFMIKRLHHEIFPDLPGKWLFVRARFPIYIEQLMHDKPFVVQLLSNFQNKLTRSALFVGNDFVGEIYFSLA